MATNTINGNTETAQPNNIASAKQSLPPAKTVDSQSVLRRLQSELMALMMSGDSGISAFPEEDNIFFWKGTITGSKDTVFEATEYKLSLSFPNDYPFKPPKVKFETTCFHPNVDVHGNICLDILQDKWSSAYDVRTILLSIQSLLGGNNLKILFMNSVLPCFVFCSHFLFLHDLEPNISSPLNPQAAQLWSNQEDYRKMVEKLYKSAN
ncbi:hypothetical protein Fmac_022622 [Flemingia macrophylla]|uniref:E2 ubiquitin-conjugating enzyme n=1 Tax=Flemingia macrophylla TaxID=520843 RepID=A0ABD1M210_9FABA